MVRAEWREGGKEGRREGGREGRKERRYWKRMEIGNWRKADKVREREKGFKGGDNA